MSDDESLISSNLDDKNRIIIKNPDGTFMHCYKTGERDSTYNKKNDNKNDETFDNLTISDADLEYIVENYDQFDQNNLLSDFLKVLRRNGILFSLLLFVEMTLSLSCFYFSWKKQNESIVLISKLYKNLTIEKAEQVFKIIFIISIILDVIYYPLGFISIYSKKYKLLNFFANFSLITGIFMIFIVYINIIFLAIFMMRIVLYTFARFICNLLISIILLPKKMQNDLNNNNNNNNNNVPNNNYDSI